MDWTVKLVRLPGVYVNQITSLQDFRVFMWTRQLLLKTSVHKILIKFFQLLDNGSKVRLELLKP